MSCNFCKNYDFSSVAVKDNEIHLAGGNTSFIEAYSMYPDVIKLFQHCPLCGAHILYDKVEANVNYKEDAYPIIVPEEAVNK